MKIVVADDLPPSALELLRAEADWIVDARSGRQPSALAADLADADALLVRSATKVDRRLLEAAPNLRIVARAGTGVDNVDVDAASARGILVVNAPGANSISVAEHACALMLALARLIPAADRAMKDGKWEKKKFLGTELRGKTLGVAGLGRIGQEVAQRARAFGMRVVAHEPPSDWSLAQLPQVIATPHIAASTEEAQELVGIETAATVRDFLRDGIVRNAVNFPSVHPDELQRLQPWIRLADHLGALVSQMGTARIEELGVRYYGGLVESRGVEVLAASAAAGVLRPILSSGVSIVNARAAARARGIDIVESRSARARHFTSLLSIKLHTDAGERWVEGTVFEPGSLRLGSVPGVGGGAPPGGTMVNIAHDGQPG